MAKKQRLKITEDGAPLTVSRPALLPGGADDLFRNFIHDFLAFSERVLAVRAGFGEFSGITGIQYTVLVSVAHMQRRGPVTINMIASHLHFSGAFITTITKQLVSKGLITKTRVLADRRQVAVKTTPVADALLARLAPIQRQVNDRLFECLGEKDFLKLAEMMSELVTCGDRAIKLLDYLKMNEECA